MKRRDGLLLGLLAGLGLGPTAGAYATPTPVEPARAAASAWLQRLDGGDLDTTWAQAASMFRQAVTAAQWADAARQVRGPLGPVASRREIGAQPTRTLPGAPDGEYVLLQFDTTFERKAAAVETLTLVLDTDGQWRVAGYFVR